MLERADRFTLVFAMAARMWMVRNESAGRRVSLPSALLRTIAELCSCLTRLGCRNHDTVACFATRRGGNGYLEET
jgi:hypothetical protein